MTAPCVDVTVPEPRLSLIFDAAAFPIMTLLRRVSRSLADPHMSAAAYDASAAGVFIDEIRDMIKAHETRLMDDKLADLNDKLMIAVAGRSNLDVGTIRASVSSLCGTGVLPCGSPCGPLSVWDNVLTSCEMTAIISRMMLARWDVLVKTSSALPAQS